jgi:hypothetical protein
MTRNRRLPVVVTALVVGGVGVGAVLLVGGSHAVPISPAPAGYSPSSAVSAPPEPDCNNPAQGQARYCAAMKAGAKRCQMWQLPPTARSDGFRTMPPDQKRAYVQAHATPINCAQTVSPVHRPTGSPTAAPTPTETPSEAPNG